MKNLPKYIQEMGLEVEVESKQEVKVNEFDNLVDLSIKKDLKVKAQKKAVAQSKKDGLTHNPFKGLKVA